jgi:hypothetical protein
MPTRNQPARIYGLFFVVAFICIVGVLGWFRAREIDSQHRDADRNLLARNTQIQNTDVANESAAEAGRDSAEPAPKTQDGLLILPPGPGEEFPELLLPMTPDRAINFERRQLTAPFGRPGRPAPWSDDRAKSGDRAWRGVSPRK